MADINHYWQLLRAEQHRIRTRIAAQDARRDLEERARELRMLVYNGTLIKPEDYPCTCEMADAYSCYEDRWVRGEKITQAEQNRECCACPCHTYEEPW